MVKAFENDVKTYGTETTKTTFLQMIVFENDVKTYGTETTVEPLLFLNTFENNVKTYGTEILQPIQYVPACLRMM